VVLVGPNHLTPAQRGRLALPNVYMTGPVPYREIPGYMSGFDVCITPHLVSAFTESLNPIKLWEYLAAGKPIVSTAVAGFRDFPEHVRIAEAAGGAKGFVAACREALAEPTGSAAARRREAQRHSWEARVDAIEAVIARVAARGSRETVLV
jgi:glycosyltransferase involved in cell wall biosynthesis